MTRSRQELMAKEGAYEKLLKLQLSVQSEQNKDAGGPEVTATSIAASGPAAKLLEKLGSPQAREL